MNERIKLLRKKLNLTQEEFATRIGLSRNFIAQLETNTKKPSDRTIMDICRELYINEEWLRNGTGEMSSKQNNTLVAKAAQMLGKKDPVFEAFVETYSELSPSDREVLLNTSMQFLKCLQKKKKEDM